MVDYSAKHYVRLRGHQSKTKMTTLQKTKLEAIAARSFSDDGDLRIGALSAPRNHFRPGQRDDDVHYHFGSMAPIL